MPVSRIRPPKWRYFVLLGAVLLLLAVIFRVVIDRPGSDNDGNVLKNAASCENIHFKSRPVVILADGGDPAPNGDTSIKLVVDVPNDDVESFKKLSDLPEPTPGPPEGGMESELKEKALADVLKASSPSDFQHVLQERASTPYSRLVVIQKTPRPDTRIYIYAGCG